MVAFVNFMPSLLAGPLFGVLVDRVRVKQAAIFTQFLSFMIAISFYAFFVLGILNELNLLFLTLCAGTVGLSTFPRPNVAGTTPGGQYFSRLSCGSRRYQF
jgi:hypothetical protein